MPRTAITKTTGLSRYPTDGVTVTEEAADTSNQNQVVLTGSELLLARNTGVSARNVTITSVADGRGRTGTITNDSIAAGAIHAYGPFGIEGWIQSDGMLYFEADHTDIKFSVIQLPI